MLSLLFVLLIATPLSVFLSCILDVPGSGLRTLETGVGTLVSVSVTDGKTSGGGAAGPWDGPSIHYCHTHGQVFPPQLQVP